MLVLEPAYLPLQPLKGPTQAATAWRYDSQNAGHQAAASSISALRSTFRPFPVKACPEVVVRIVERPAKRPRMAVAQDRQLRPIRRCDVDAVRSLQVRTQSLPFHLLPEQTSLTKELPSQNASLPIDYPLRFYTALMCSPTSACIAVYPEPSATVPTGFIAAQLITPALPPDRKPSAADLPQDTATGIQTVYILSLAVAPTARRQGIANDLLRAACAKLCGSSRRGPVKISLHVAADNTAALSFYRKAGLEATATLPNFYRRTRDGLVRDGISMQGVIEL